jgi:hypothetical protein
MNYNCGHMYGIDYGSPGAQQYIDSWADLVSWPSSASPAAAGQKEARADSPAWATSMSWL